MPGEFGARKLKSERKHFQRADPYHTQFVRRAQGKFDDPLEGAPQASGIVVEKVGVEQKQPHSGIVKCVKVQLLKNGITVTAHAPRDGAINFIDEHDEVVVEGLGGSQAGCIGSMWGVKYRVIKVNGIDLQELRTGRKEKPKR